MRLHADGLLSMRQLSIGYAGQRAPLVERLSASLAAGELVCLLGPNGAGKSTLMRTLAGMQAPLAGEVVVQGAPIHALDPRERARRISVVLTDRVQPWMMSTYDLVALGRHPYTGWSGRLAARDHERVEWALATAGAAELATRPVAELSDGERQKVMLARALAQEPDIMLLDEITAFLDLPRRVAVMSLLRSLAHDAGRALLLSTHDLDLALRTADRVWLLSRGGGFAVGTPEQLVLNGAFERAFASEGVEFDRVTGAFRVRHRTLGSACVVGEGMLAAWTARALERVGYEVLDSPLADVLVQLEDGRWRCRTGASVVACESLEDVLQAIARVQPAGQS